MGFTFTIDGEILSFRIILEQSRKLIDRLQIPIFIYWNFLSWPNKYAFIVCSERHYGWWVELFQLVDFFARQNLFSNKEILVKEDNVAKLFVTIVWIDLKNILERAKHVYSAIIHKILDDRFVAKCSSTWSVFIGAHLTKIDQELVITLQGYELVSRCRVIHIETAFQGDDVPSWSWLFWFIQRKFEIIDVFCHIILTKLFMEPSITGLIVYFFVSISQPHKRVIHTIFATTILIRYSACIKFQWGLFHVIEVVLS